MSLKSKWHVIWWHWTHYEWFWRAISASFKPMRSYTHISRYSFSPYLPFLLSYFLLSTSLYISHILRSTKKLKKLLQRSITVPSFFHYLQLFYLMQQIHAFVSPKLISIQLFYVYKIRITMFYQYYFIFL